MRTMMSLLGTGLVKKERRVSNTTALKEKEAQKKRRKVSVELFLRNILGTHLIEKKF